MLEIKNCTTTECDFKLQSWHDQHICDTDGQIVLTGPTTGAYTNKKYIYDSKNNKEYFIPVGITFGLLSNNHMSLKYANPGSHGAFCGMTATVEGVWHKIQN